MRMQFRLLVLAVLALLSIPAVADGVKGTIRTIDYPTTNGEIQLQVNKAGVMTTLETVKGSTGRVGINTTVPGQTLDVFGLNSASSTSGSVADGIARFHPTGSNLVLDIGAQSSPAHAWLQARDSTSFATNFSLSLNPNGGLVGIGTDSPIAALDVNGRIHTIDGTLGSPAITFSTDNNTGIYHPTGNNVTTVINGSSGLEVNANNVIFGSSGSLSAPGIAFSGDNNTGIYHPAGNRVATVINGTNVFEVGSAGIITQGGGSFNVKTFSGTISAGGTVDFTSPGSAILGVFGYAQNNGGSAYSVIGTSNQTWSTSVSTINSVRLLNSAGSGCLYKVVMIYL